MRRVIDDWRVLHPERTDVHVKRGRCDDAARMDNTRTLHGPSSPLFETLSALRCCSRRPGWLHSPPSGMACLREVSRPKHLTSWNGGEEPPRLFAFLGGAPPSSPVMAALICRRVLAEQLRSRRPVGCILLLLEWHRAPCPLIG